MSLSADVEIFITGMALHWLLVDKFIICECNRLIEIIWHYPVFTVQQLTTRDCCITVITHLNTLMLCEQLVQ